VGERPPSADLVFGWWFAGWGQVGDGSCDVVLGSSEPTNFSSYSNAPTCNANTVYPYAAGTAYNPCDQYHFWSFHPGGSQFVFADGSARMIAYSVGNTVLNALATRANNDVAPVLD
jgi:prepilin-type processing-associated H-X9-DG protein